VSGVLSKTNLGWLLTLVKIFHVEFSVASAADFWIIPMPS
jgi:hypothetical protein